MSRLKALIHEIHRRSLWQVLVIYVGGSWAVLAVVDTLAGALGLPDWAPRFAFFLLVIMLPIVLATAFVQEGLGADRDRAPDGTTASPGERVAADPSGPADEGEAGAGRAAHHRILTWRNAIVGGVVALALWGMVAAGYLLFVGANGLGDGAPGAEDGAGGTTAPTGRLSVTTRPDGLLVRALPVPDTGATLRDTISLGRSPTAPRPLPAGEYLLVVGDGQHGRLSVLATVAAGGTTTTEHRLSPRSDETEGMVLVEAGPDPLEPSGPAVAPFLIDRTEVTNRAYADFLAAGGYGDESLWPTTMEVEGRTLTRSEALERFTDRTGQAGPRGWSGGVFPGGRADHPVVGISWYEARAYAQWAGKELPSWSQWWRAALGSERRAYPWGDDVEGVERRANFGRDGTAPVGAFPLGVSPFGALDMAGNVREWLLERPAGRSDRRVAVGGAWQDPSYAIDPSLADRLPPGYASETVGFRCVRPWPQDSP